MNKRISLTVLICGMFAATVARAGIIATEEWTAAGTATWGISAEIGPPAGSLNNPGAGGNPGGYLAATDNTGGDFGINTDLITQNSIGSPFLGSYATYASEYVSFDFYFDSNTSAFSGGSGLQLYFISGITTWLYNIDVSGQAPDTWTGYNVSFGSSAGWFDVYGIGTPFDTDKTAVTDIGFRLTYLTDTDNQSFGFDNFTRGYAVPEPETYAAIGFALISLAIAFRRELRTAVAQISGQART